MQNLSKLKDLGLYFNCSHSVSVLTDSHLTYLTRLERLKLCTLISGKCFKQYDCLLFLDSLPNLSNIQQFELSIGPLSLFSGDFEAKIMLSLQYLILLKQLKCNVTTIAGTKGLSKSLRRLPKLENLEVYVRFPCTINKFDEGEEILINTLQHLTNLKHLNLRIGWLKNVEALVNSFSHLVNLENLELILLFWENCNNEEERVMLSLHNLKLLKHFKCNFLTQSGIMGLLQSFPKMANLETATLGNRDRLTRLGRHNSDSDIVIDKAFIDSLPFDKLLQIVSFRGFIMDNDVVYSNLSSVMYNNGVWEVRKKKT